MDKFLRKSSGYVLAFGIGGAVGIAMLLAVVCSVL